jgi:predicted transcriptional regulator
VYLSNKSKTILNHINRTPGIRYRQLLRSTGLARGVLSCHLKKLEKKKVIRVKRPSSAMTRYYPITVKSKESDILDCILPTTKKEIVFFLLKHDKCIFREILHHIKKAPSTTSSHLKDLENCGIVISVFKHSNNNLIYKLKNKTTIAKILSKYKKIL